MNIIKKYENLKLELNKIGFIAPGRLRTTYLRCGKPNCKCQKAKKPSDKHGPYVFWDRKVNEKLSSMSLKPDEVKELEQYIENRKKFDSIVEKMKILGEEIVALTKNNNLKSG